MMMRALLTTGVLFSLEVATATAAFHGECRSFAVSRSASSLLHVDTDRRPQRRCREQDATATTSTSSTSPTTSTALFMSDWPSISSFDNDDDDIIMSGVDTNTDYATEDDSQEKKAAVGELRVAPTIDYPAEPIQVPAGSQLELSEDTVLGVLAACREELGTLFGCKCRLYRRSVSKKCKVL
jgi:hypothetical protein